VITASKVALSSFVLNQSVLRASRILKVLAAGRGDLSLSEIGSRVGLHPSTTYRLLVTLEGEGLVERGLGRNGYHLGLEMIRLGTVALDSQRLGQEAYPLMQRLADVSGETVNLGVLRGLNAIYLQKIEAKELLRADLVVGAVVPAYCTGLGKALLHTAGDLGSAIGPIAAYALLPWLDLRGVYLLCALLLAAGLGPALRLHSRERAVGKRELHTSG